MPERKVASCRSCGAEVLWVKTRKKKNMPLDVGEDSSGRFVINGELEDGTPTVGYLGDQEAKVYSGPRYQSHFKTCPNADQHRRR